MTTLKHIFLICALLFLSHPAIAMQKKPKIAVVGLFKNAAYIEVGGQKQLIRVGQSTSQGAKLVSADSKSAVFLYQGKKYSYKLGNKINSSYSNAALTEVILTPNASGMYHVSGWINNYPVAFLVDTGATAITINEVQAKSINLNYTSGTPINVHTASGAVKGFRLTLKTVRIDKLTLSNIEAIVVPGEFPKHALLGNSFLKHLDIQRQGTVLKLIKKW